SQNHDFCPECGAKTQTKCMYCETPIEGGICYLGLIDLETHKQRVTLGDDLESVPAFCSKCGKKFPWHGKLSDKTKSILKKITENKLVNTVLGSATSELTKAALPK
ncbi:MAG TPA: DUF2321 domain-containing protein, partial [Candidatus Baltobacteraceae bacterium]|nr:DUF2321 domain-containing protein [Candidatus Baltobacteraceae bacterium]